MTLAIITNANVDTACAAVPGPYGPLTRVGSVSNTSPNSNIGIAVTSFFNVPLVLSYEEILDLPTLAAKLERLHAKVGSTALKLDILANVVAAKIASYGALPFTGTEIQDAFEAFAYEPSIIAMVPNRVWDEVDKSGLIVFSSVSAAVTLVSLQARLQFTLTGEVALLAVDWGDGLKVVNYTPVTTFDVLRVYGSAGAKKIRIMAIGRGGVVERYISVTVAVI